MKITPGQAEALARFLLTVRPDWSKFYTTEAVREMRHISDDLETITAAAVRGALSPKIIKPDVLAMHGEHWKQPASSHSRGAVTTIDGRCESCGRLHMPTDPCPPPAEEARAATASGIQNVRQALRDTRAERLCPHSVLPRDCADCRPTQEAQ